jgi:hypothetical protein
VSAIVMCLTFILTLCLAFAPSDILAVGRSSDGPTFSEMPSDEQLLLIDYLSFGSTIDDVQSFFPDSTFDEDHFRELQNFELPVEIDGIPVRLRFAMKDGALYAIWYHTVLSIETGESLFVRLTKFYSALHGEPIVSDEWDSPYFVMSRRWCAESYEAGVSMSLAQNTRLVGWGFQHPCGKTEKRSGGGKLMRQSLDGCR